MGTCEEIETCEYINDVLASMPTVAALVKQRYCQGDPSQCALRTLLQTTGGRRVPARHTPNNLDQTREMIGKLL